MATRGWKFPIKEVEGLRLYYLHVCSEKKVLISCIHGSCAAGLHFHFCICCSAPLFSHMQKSRFSHDMAHMINAMRCQVLSMDLKLDLNWSGPEYS